MMTMQKLLKLLFDYPDCYIYYTDNGSFVLYKEKPRSHKEKYLKTIELYSGTDAEFSKGYAPTLVVALATFIGIDIGSI